MIELFKMGGPLFMGLLTLLLVGVILLTVKYSMSTSKNDEHVASVKSLGLLALVIGILGQLLGLFQAFNSIEMVGSVSPALLYSGIKVSMITTIYGLMIFFLAHAIATVLTIRKS